MYQSNQQTISAYVGNRKILRTIAAHTMGDVPIRFEVEKMIFVFNFATDDGKPRYLGEVKEGELHLTLFNHSNSLGEGMFAPINVATLEDKILSLTYYVTTLNSVEKVRRFECTFYLGEE